MRVLLLVFIVMLTAGILYWQSQSDSLTVQVVNKTDYPVYFSLVGDAINASKLAREAINLPANTVITQQLPVHKQGELRLLIAHPQLQMNHLLAADIAAINHKKLQIIINDLQTIQLRFGE